MFIYSNNKLVPEKDFIVSYKSRAYRYGDGVFETLKVRKGVPLFLKHHYSRLILALHTLHYEIPEHWSYSFFVYTLIDLAKQNNIKNGNLRIQVSRLGEGKYLPTSNGCDLMMEIHPIAVDAYVLNQETFTLGLYTEMFKPTGKWSNFKLVNSQIYVQASIFKQQQNFNEVLILNEHGRVADASTANVFAVINNLLICPPSNEGGIDGVLRRVLVKLCKQHKIELQQAPLSLTDIKDAGEIFLTNVIKGIMPVTQFNNQTLSSTYAQQLHNLLLEKEEKEVQSLREFV